MGCRRAVEGHDAVADVLVDMSAVVLDDTAEAIEAIVHKAVNGLWVEPLRHCGKTRHVGKQDCDVTEFIARAGICQRLRRACVAHGGARSANGEPVWRREFSAARAAEFVSCRAFGGTCRACYVRHRGQDLNHLSNEFTASTASRAV